MTDKLKRQQALQRLIRRRPAHNQNEIVAEMCRLGFDVTQASVSRDISELGLVKLKGRYVSAETLTPRAAGNGRTPPPEPLGEMITHVDTAGASLLVVRTRTGAATPIAVALDNTRLPEIVGTIAGDDTIFVAVRSRAAQGRVRALLKYWMQGGQRS
ncbi:MAG: Arginine repressor [Phycisphaerae bacterium]|nr:Arginine repressor [Phycisphaerae bacterium]